MPVGREQILVEVLAGLKRCPLERIMPLTYGFVDWRQEDIPGSRKIRSEPLRAVASYLGDVHICRTLLGCGRMETFFAGLASGLGAANVGLVLYVLRRLENRIDSLYTKLDGIEKATTKVDKDLAVHIEKGHPPPTAQAVAEILQLVPPQRASE